MDRMTDTTVELTEEEAERLAAVENDADALDSVIEELGSRSRRKRQFSARVLHLLAENEPELLAPYISDMVDALENKEAQTRWEVLDALTLLALDHGKEVGAAFEGAETALFDESNRSRPFQKSVADSRRSDSVLSRRSRVSRYACVPV